MELAHLPDKSVAATQLFIHKTASLYTALHGLSCCLSKSSDAEEVRSLINPCLAWVLQVKRAVSQVVVILDRIAKSTVDELSQLECSSLASTSVLKAEFKVVTENLSKLGESRQQALKYIEECEALTGKVVWWGGQPEKMQHAIISVIGNFGGAAQFEALASELQEKQIALTESENKVRELAKKVEDLTSEMEDLQSYSLVYENVAMGELEAAGLEKVANAHAEVASIKNRLMQLALDFGVALQERCLADEMMAVAEAECSQAETRYLDLCKANFKGLDLPQIAALQDRLQEVPMLLQAMAVEDSNMFAFFTGRIRRHEMLCQRIATFLDEDDDNECPRVVKALQPSLSEAIQNAQLFDHITKQMKGFVPVSLDTVTPSRILAPRNAAATLPATPMLTELADEEEEDLF
eukprot:Skav223458  [mRNA]  locus=scaffold184:273453:274679:+ [translate_table: standard]